MECTCLVRSKISRIKSKKYIIFIVAIKNVNRCNKHLISIFSRAETIIMPSKSIIKK